MSANVSNLLSGHPTSFRRPMLSPNLASVTELRNEDRDEALAFLAVRPVHTVVMSSFIIDNGVESERNRGRFFAYRNDEGRIEGIALIGHATLVEARTARSMTALAFAAQHSETPISLVMSSGSDAELFWTDMTGGSRQPRVTCNELLFELSFPMPVVASDPAVRLATIDLLEQVAEAQADIAVLESGVNPLERDREGFLARVARRIEQGRVFVVEREGKLMFKADVIAEASGVFYLEGVYAAPEARGAGFASACLAEVGSRLLEQGEKVCLLSNIEFDEAHRCFRRAGFRSTGSCVTLFM